MAYLFDVNQPVVADSIAAMFRLKETLKAAGWTVPSSSDGLTYSATTDVITNANAGIGGLRNNRAWFRLKQPGTNGREFCIQIPLATAAGNWRVKYSGGPGTGFTGGSPSITVVPSATDEVVLVGSGTDAAPTAGTAMTSGLNYRYNIVAGGAAENYNFYTFHVHSSSTYATYSIFLDTLAAGSAHPLDVDPAVVYWPSSASAGFWSVSDMSGDADAMGVRGWIGKGIAGGGFTRTPVITYSVGTTAVVPSTLGSNVYDGKDELYPVMYGRAGASPNGIKGVSTLLRWAGQPRAPFDTLSLTGTKDIVILGGSASATAYAALPWNGTDVLL